MLESGTAIGSYVIDGPIARGGMGMVYRATPETLSEPGPIDPLMADVLNSGAASEVSS